MLKRMLLPLALIGATLTSVASVSAGTAKDTFDLKGEVYTNFKIEMKNSANRKLTTVKAGTHRIKIEDMAAIHNFHLVGPGVNRKTGVAYKGTTKAWAVTLRKGTLRWLCDPHALRMRGTARVG